jgi:cytoskeleton protein RodZ
LALRTSAEAWVEVRDSRGEVLISRTLRAGETVTLDGTPPLRATLGNATAVNLSFRGEPVDLSASTRGNVARLELR